MEMNDLTGPMPTPLPPHRFRLVHWQRQFWLVEIKNHKPVQQIPFLTPVAAALFAVTLQS